MHAFAAKKRIRVVAEMAQSYEGSVSVAIETAEKICHAGVDAAMFQIVYADELAIPDYRLYGLFRSLEMPKADWKRIVKTIHDSGGLGFGEVFGKRSADVARDAGMDGFKIHITDINNLELLDYIGRTNLPVLLATGGALENELQSAINAIKVAGNCEIILMHGYQLCPTELSDTHILKISALQKTFGLPVGYSDHSAGCIKKDVSRMNPLALTLPLLALGAGAKVIEKHAIPDRTKAWEDHESALTPDEMRIFVDLIREMEAALGENDLEPNQAEKTYSLAKKSVVAACDLKAGTVLSEKNTALKRVNGSDKGFASITLVAGKALRRAAKTNDLIQKDNLQTCYRDG